MTKPVYPSRISLAQLPTPLQPLKRWQKKCGGPLIWVKRDDMTGATLTGNKVRKLEFLLAHAIENDYGAVITSGGIQSNHCRATAFAATQLGLESHLILRGEAPEETPEANHFLDTLTSATLSFHVPQEYFKNLTKIFEEKINEYAQKGIKALAIPTGGSDEIGVWGYIAACQELHNDFNDASINPKAVLCATGSGGTQAGLILGSGFYLNDLSIYGINVCDDEAWFVNKIKSDIAAWKKRYQQPLPENYSDDLSINVIDGYVGEGYGKASDEVLATIKQLSSTEGILLDPVYSGKAFAGLQQEIKKGRFTEQDDIVFIHTGGMFGLIPFAERLG